MKWWEYLFCAVYVIGIVLLVCSMEPKQEDDDTF